MPGEVIDRPNPQAPPSHIPDVVQQLQVQLQRTSLDQPAYDALMKFRRAAGYIAAAMIFLQDNVLLKRDLVHDDIKSRLLGHWGTCPGLILVYSHMNYLIRQHNLDMLYVVGPGHGAPGILAALWLEGSLEKFYPQYSRDGEGLKRLISTFSTPAGLPRSVMPLPAGSQGS
ncbi:XFP N-terminal domain-containing protein [Aspergillus floccosus]